MMDSRLNSTFLKTRDSYISKLAEMGIRTLRDLLLYFPRSYRDEQDFKQIQDLKLDELNVVQGKVKSIFSKASQTGKMMTRAVVEDSTGELPVLWFNQPHLKTMFFPGSPIVLTGKLKYERGRPMMLSPKYERPAGALVHTGRIVPLYPESETITSKWLREKIFKLLRFTSYFDEFLPEEVLRAEGLMSLSDAIYHVHFAQDEEHLKKARERLAFDELFILQLRALRRKKMWQEEAAASFFNNKGEELSLQPFLDSLPFKLTGAQIRVLNEIEQDLNRAFPMLRLVQGDVGSGKTVIAFAAIYLMFKKGSQSALMAPTEILAKQHFKTCEKFLKPMGINVQLLTGSTPESDRRAILQQTKTGTCDLLVGTHALIQDDVEFSKLELVVIDEQHRFGVKQREQFRKHGFPHVLSLSATPIPRTMALTLYGDQDLSILDELPPGRKEIVTRIVPEAKRDDASFWINDQIRKGRQIFVICPLIETSEVLEVKAATEEFKRLNEDVFPEHRSALLHGRMKSNEKEAIMNAFSKGEVDILVSTAVVEVGIDVPNASIMMIEGADRFGLAQLHQFRGRVGRGEHQSYCFLFTDSQSQDALLRLKYMVKYNSGFDLAEMDLALRGPGEVYGVKQSGLPDLKIATYTDVDLLKRVRSRADDLLKEDVMLSRYPLLRQKVEYVDEGSIGF